MSDWVKDIGIPLFTFFAGFGIEHFRQAKNAKNEMVNALDEKLRIIIDKVNSNERNIALLKYEYNAVHRKVEDFCSMYGGEIDFFNEDLISLNLHSTSDFANANKVSACAISIINKIKKL